MARPPTTQKGKQGFIWLPKDGSLVYDIKIDGTSVLLDSISAEFTKTSFPDIGSFKLSLINADGSYTGMFNQGSVVELFMDYSDGTALHYTGKIDKADGSQGDGINLDIEGTHVTGELVYVYVTERFDGDTDFVSILNTLNNNYLTGYTVVCTVTYTGKPFINWEENSFVNCLTELCKIANADCFVDDDRTIYIYDKGTRLNEQEAIVWDDTLIEVKGLGKQSMTAKSKVKVYGDDGTGLPVIYQTDDDTTQPFGVKEQLVQDTSIDSSDYAKQVGDAEKQIGVNTPNETEGEATCLILPTIKPPEKIWITHPIMKIHGQYSVYKITHKFPDQNTLLTVGKERKMAQVMKKTQQQIDQTQQSTNPYKMTRSWNLKFDSVNELSGKDANVNVSGGKVSLSSGTQGIFSCSMDLDFAVGAVHLKAVGSNLSLVIFELSLDGGNTYRTLTLEQLIFISTPGSKAILRVTLVNNTDIDSIAMLYKR